MTSSVFTNRLASSIDYDRAPEVHDIQGIFQKHADVIEAIAGLLKEHGVEKNFSLFAFHKHFNVPAEHCLLLEPIDIADGDKGEVVCPVSKSTLGVVHPVAFYVDGDKLQAYKCAKGPGPDLTVFEGFFRKFIEAINRFSLNNVFSIKFPNISPKVKMLEAELPEYGATILLPKKYFEDSTGEGAQAAVTFGDCGYENEHHGPNKSGTKHTVFVDAFKMSNPGAIAAFALLEANAKMISWAA